MYFTERNSEEGKWFARDDRALPLCQPSYNLRTTAGGGSVVYE